MLDAQILIDKDELDRYQSAVKAVLNDELNAERFQSMRLQQGIYGQRQDGVNMVRIKLPGGRLSPDQAINIAELLEKYSGHDKMHVTTRQAIQIHYIPLEKTPDAIRHMATEGLTSREACNNTVRNITACPLAGICPSEHTDVQPFLEDATQHFLRHPLAQHLPRKFKMSFSGCEADCAQGMIHDLAVVAVKKDGRPGFKILAGGGLGHKPRKAIVVEEFIEEHDLLASMEAVIAVHNRYSDRKRRAKSRIKFLVEKFGEQGFIEKYHEELPRTLAAMADKTPTRGEWNDNPTKSLPFPGAPRDVFNQKQSGMQALPIHLPLGDMSADQFRAIAQIMKAHDLNELRTTQDQSLLITHIKQADVETIASKIAQLGLAKPTVGDSVTACPGTTTCRLGITASRTLANKVNGGDDDLRIRVSGCHNGCAQPETGDIGVYGEGKRLHGKLIPHYRIYIGGSGQGNGNIAIKGPTIPSARIEQAITILKDTYRSNKSGNETFFDWSQAKDKTYFAELLEDVRSVSEDELNSVLRDHGDAIDFRVEQFGGGECAGAAQENVSANFAEAANERNYRNAFLLQRKYDDSIECAEIALRLTSNSLLFLSGNKDEQQLNTIANTIIESLPQQSELSEQLKSFSSSLAQLSDKFDAETYNALIKNMDSWTADVAKACQNIDQQLDLSASLPDSEKEETKKKRGG